MSHQGVGDGGRVGKARTADQFHSIPDGRSGCRADVAAMTPAGVVSRHSSHSPSRPAPKIRASHARGRLVVAAVAIVHHRPFVGHNSHTQQTQSRWGWGSSSRFIAGFVQYSGRQIICPCYGIAIHACSEWNHSHGSDRIRTYTDRYLWYRPSTVALDFRTANLTRFI